MVYHKNEKKRIIIIGIRKDIEVVFKVPSTKPFTEVDISAKNALENPPIPKDFPDHDYTKQSLQVIERLKHIKPGENAFTANLPDHLTLNVKGAKISQIYKRLDASKPAYTITGSGGMGTIMYIIGKKTAHLQIEREHACKLSLIILIS